MVLKTFSFAASDRASPSGHFRPLVLPFFQFLLEFQILNSSQSRIKHHPVQPNLLTVQPNSSAKTSTNQSQHINKMKLSTLLIPLTTLTTLTSAGPAAYGICQAGCSAVVVACYSGAGFTFGTVTAGAGIPAAIVACNSAYGTCQAACAAVLIAPTP